MASDYQDLRAETRRLNDKIDNLQELLLMVLSGHQPTAQQVTRTPTPLAIPGAASISPPQEQGALDLAAAPQTPTELQKEQQETATNVPNPPRPNALEMLFMGAKARATNEASYSNTTVSEVIHELYCCDDKPLKNLEVKGLSSFRYIPIHPKAKNKYIAAMDLADALLTTEMRATAIKGELDANSAKQVFSEIDELVKGATAAFEGKSEVTIRRKANWQGVGNAVIKARRQTFVCEYIPLVNLEELEAEMTTPEYSSGSRKWMVPEGKTVSLAEWIKREQKAIRLHRTKTSK